MKGFPELEYEPLPTSRSLVRLRPKELRRQAKELLEAHANGEIELTPSQMRACIALLPFQTPKLAVVSHVDGGSIGEMLDRALARSHPKTIEHRPGDRDAT
jgi:hypothetical protein